MIKEVINWITKIIVFFGIVILIGFIESPLITKEQFFIGLIIEVYFILVSIATKG